MAETVQHPASGPAEKRDPLLAFLGGLGAFSSPVEAISSLGKHEKMEGAGSWTAAEMESELLYWVHVYLTHLGCPLEYAIPCARAIVTEVFGGDFRVESFLAPPSQLAKIEAGGLMEAGWDGTDHEIHIHGQDPDPFHGHNGNGTAAPDSNGALENGKGEPVVSARSLYHHAVDKANELLTRWKENPPHVDPVALPHKVSIYATRNKRPGMEDRHVVIPDLRATVDLKGIKEPVSFYAVYDGHAGPVAASYCAAHLHRLAVSSKHFPDNIPEALKEAFLATDELYKEKGERDQDFSGTTAVVAVIYDKKLYIAWVGDSEAAIVQNGQAARLVEPRHVASDEGERKRVMDQGGTVIMNQGGWRVGAILTVTRAIGDSTLKPYVTAEPDVRVVELTGNEDYLVIACDGLWDELDPVGAMQETNRFLREHPDRAGDVAKALSEKARKSGSLDNITVLVVMLKPVEEILALVQQDGPVSVKEPDSEVPMNNVSGSPDDFADLADAAEFGEMDYQNAGHNPFDDTPLDASGLDLGEQSGTIDTEWTYQKSEAEDPESALDVLDQAIGQGNESLLSFDEEVPPTQTHPSSSAVVDANGPAFVDTPPHHVQTTTVTDLLDQQRKAEEQRAEKVPDFVNVFSPQQVPARTEPHDENASHAVTAQHDISHADSAPSDRLVEESSGKSAEPGPAALTEAPAAQTVPVSEPSAQPKENAPTTPKASTPTTKTAGKTPPAQKPTPAGRTLAKTPAAASSKTAASSSTKAAASPTTKTAAVGRTEAEKKPTTTPPAATTKRPPAAAARPAATPRASTKVPDGPKPGEPARTPRAAVPKASPASRSMPTTSGVAAPKTPAAASHTAGTSKPASVPSATTSTKRTLPATPRPSALVTAPSKRTAMASKSPAVSEKKPEGADTIEQKEGADKASATESGAAAAVKPDVAAAPVKTATPAARARSFAPKPAVPSARKTAETVGGAGDAASKSPVTETTKPVATNRAQSAKTSSTASARLSTKSAAKTPDSAGSKPVNGTGAPRGKTTPAASARSAPSKKTPESGKVQKGSVKDAAPAVNGVREEKASAGGNAVPSVNGEVAVPSQPANVDESAPLA